MISRNPDEIRLVYLQDGRRRRRGLGTSHEKFLPEHTQLSLTHEKHSGSLAIHTRAKLERGKIHGGEARERTILLDRGESSRASARSINRSKHGLASDGSGRSLLSPTTRDEQHDPWKLPLFLSLSLFVDRSTPVIINGEQLSRVSRISLTNEYIPHCC